MQTKLLNYTQSKLFCFFVASGLIAAFSWISIAWFLLRLQVSFANEQILVFRQLSEVDNIDDQAQLQSNLSYIKEYYPSGTKQNPGSRLDEIVERERSEAIHRINERIRQIERHKPDTPSDRQ